MLSSSQLIPGGLMDEYLAEGGSQASGYVRKLIAKRQVDVNKIKKPSSWLLNVYPTLVRRSSMPKDIAATKIQRLFRGRQGRRKPKIISRSNLSRNEILHDQLDGINFRDLGRRKARKKKMN